MLHRQIDNVQDVSTFMTLDAIKEFKHEARRNGFIVTFGEIMGIDEMFNEFLKETRIDSASLLKLDAHDWNVIVEMWMNFLREHEVFLYTKKFQD